MFATNAEELNVWEETSPGVFSRVELMRKESPKVSGVLMFHPQDEAPYVAQTESVKFTKAYHTKQELFDEWDIVREEEEE